MVVYMQLMVVDSESREEQAVETYDIDFKKFDTYEDAVQWFEDEVTVYDFVRAQIENNGLTAEDLTGRYTYRVELKTESGDTICTTAWINEREVF